MLERRELTLTTIALLAPVRTQESVQLLELARSKSKQEVQALLAQHAPKPDAPDSVRRLPSVSPRVRARAPRVENDGLFNRVSIVGASSTEQAHDREAAAAERPVHARAIAQGPVGVSARPKGEVVPLSAERHKISFTGSQRVRDLLREAQDLRRHRYPAGDLEPLFERALELLVEEEKKRKLGRISKPRKQAVRSRSGKPHSRYIPRAVRQQVWARHGGQCCFVALDGHRCEARSRLEFEHVEPFGRGGSSNAENLVLLCDVHNRLKAERDYGRAFIRQRIEQSASGRVARVVSGIHDSATQPCAP
jgi:5-methylcytosine-specific restriction endonuclease McrA